MIKNYDMELDVLTPVIINNGETYQFGELLPSDKKFDIKDADKDIPLPEIREFYLNNTKDMFGKMTLTEIKKYIDKMTIAISKRDDASLKECRRILIHNTAGVKKVTMRVLKKAFADLSNKPGQQVSKIVSSSFDAYTYIPGSSIKGALRTGLLESLRKERNIDHWSSSPYTNRNLPKQRKMKDAQNFEMEVMKNKPKEFNINEDPFKYIKISDFIFSGTDAVTYISKVGDDERMPIYSAMTNSYAFSGKYVIAKGTFSVDDRFYEEIGLEKTTNFQHILDMAGDFYLDNMNSILTEIRSPLMKYVYKSVYAPMISSKGSKDNIIRLGHYVGIKNYTFNVNQLEPQHQAPHDINIRGGRVVKLEEGVLPGICIIRIVKE